MKITILAGSAAGGSVPADSAGRTSDALASAGRVIEAPVGGVLFDALRRAGVFVSSDCNGKGRCGKCLVRTGASAAPVKACEVRLNADITVELVNLAPQDAATGSSDPAKPGAPRAVDAPAIAIDLGTTTIAASLIDTRTGETLASLSALNEQRAYGADILSRIDESLADASLLAGIIRAQLASIIQRLLTGAAPQSPLKLYISGNTTMSYLLLGLPCRSLASAPFRPEFPIAERYAGRDIFPDAAHLADPAHATPIADILQAAEVYLLPYLSAFVGGDILSGLLTLPPDEDWLFVDLGTNGEMVLQKDGKRTGTSAAAGPAFEGGGISCGMGGLPGAIYELSPTDATAPGALSLRYKTIDGLPPEGLCGSGILDAMAVLLASGTIDRTGAFTVPAKDNQILIAEHAAPVKQIYLTQKDVRVFQLSKGAIRAGIEVLCAEAGGLPEKIYLAGGFGQALRPESAITTGLLPAEARGRITSLGNTSLIGATMLAKGQAPWPPQQEIPFREIILAEHPQFNDLFIKHMEF